MSNDMQEMTLDEWCAKLSDFHLVNKQLAALKAESARLREAFGGEVLKEMEVEALALVKELWAAEMLDAHSRAYELLSRIYALQAALKETDQ